MSKAPDQSRLEKRKTEFREKIADAAYELFVRDGVSNTSVAAIVKHADIAHQTFFNHFPTKNHLLLHIAGRLGELANAIFEETEAMKMPPPDKLDYCFTRMVEETAKFNPNIKELISIVLIGTPEETNEIKADQDMRLDQTIRTILLEAQEQKLLVPGFTVETLAEIVKGMYVANFLNWARKDNYPIIGKMAELLRFIRQGVFVSK